VQLCFVCLMFSVGLLIVRLSFMTDIVFCWSVDSMIDCDCIDLFSCTAASLFNQLPSFLTYLYLKRRGEERSDGDV